MRRALGIAAVLAALASPALATPTIVQAIGCDNYNATLSCTLPSAVASGDVLVQMSFSNTTTAAMSVSGCGAAWTQVTGGSDTNGSVFVFVGTGASGPCTTSQTVSSGNFNDAALLEVSGVSATTDGSGIAYASCGGAGVCAGPTVTTAVGGDIIISAGDDFQSASIVPSWEAPFSSDLNQQISSPDTVTISGAETVQASAGTATPSFTSTGGAAAYYHLGAVALEESARGPSAPTCTLSLLGVGSC